MFRVMFRCLLGMVLSMKFMAVGGMRVMGRLLVATRFMMLRGFCVMLGRIRVVLRRF